MDVWHPQVDGRVAIVHNCVRTERCSLLLVTQYTNHWLHNGVVVPWWFVHSNIESMWQEGTLSLDI